MENNGGGFVSANEFPTGRGRGRGIGRGNWPGRGRGRGSGRGRHGDTSQEVDRPQKPVKASSALQIGEIATLNLKENFGFMTPITGNAEAPQPKNVYFRCGDDSKTETGLLDVEVGDVFQYSCNDYPDRPRAMYARLLECKRRSPLALGNYLDKLLSISAYNPGKVIREITKCPVGFLLLLGLRKPPLIHASSVLKLADILSNHKEAAFYSVRLKQFYNLFCGTEFLRSSDSFREYVLDNCNEEEEGTLIRKFMLLLLEHVPDIVSDLFPLLVLMTESMEEDCTTTIEANSVCMTPSSYCKFLVDFVRAQASVTINSSLQPEACKWDNMPLVPIDSEIGDGPKRNDGYSAMATNSSFGKRLPSVKKNGSYGSVEEYLDTYYQLLREDCFAPLRKGLSDLKADKLDPRDMKVWINGSVIGVHFGTRAPGITFAIKAERQGKRSGQPPMPGTLLCISDSGGNFDSPIWSVVARCEADKNSTVIFAEVVDARAELGGVSVQSISRLLSASNIVFAENPTFYKAYEPILRGLQQMDVEKFPFTEEFVYTRWTNRPPEYLTPWTTVNWGCLFDEKEVRAGVGEVDNLIKSGYRTTLDESQLNAVKLAVKNRLVLIQGPPGTGKSFVGVRILEILLSADTLPPGPALVVTYKNQGLDHFLVSCMKFCPDDVIRVGGRSTEPSLENRNLSSLVNKFDEFTPDWYDNIKKLEQAQRETEEALQQLQESYAFNVETVLRHMPDLQLKQLLSGMDSNKAFILNLLPEGMSIVDYIANDTPESKKLYQTISTTIMHWMPRKETFKLVEDCFCVQKVPRTLKQIGDKNESGQQLESEASKDFDEENIEGNVLLQQFLDAKSEDADQFSGETKKGAKNNEWLNDNFFHLKRDKVDKSFSNIKRLNNVDIGKYEWLLDENPWDLNETHKAILVQIIMQMSHEAAFKRFADAKKAYDEICQDMDEINKRRQLEVLKKAKIVGMTTTGAAINQEILKMLRPSIIFFEEAAEVLEPQLLAVLGPSVQHLILIGDHYQLSPSVGVYELESRHGFAVSLFERLVEHNAMPFQALSAQSRMREEFVPMILPIYPNIRTNTRFVSGERNKAPVCMASPMYFWSHSYQETKQRSVSNEGEAKMVIALLRWMLAEGQKPEEITVLASYNGQVTLLREMLGKLRIEDVQVLTIDRFQGSENKVIILSLVRSNEEGSVGHVGKRNRLCVAVSRARGGMYFCGNDVALAKKSVHWRTLLDCLGEKKCVGNMIYLRCPRHPASPPFAISSKEAHSFNPVLCKRVCNSKLKCGHYCRKACHFGDHPKCDEPVQFVFSSCGHEATKMCSEDEEKQLCQLDVFHRFYRCGHINGIKCWKKTSKELKCSEPCRNVLDCGHPCRLKCYENCKANQCSACVQIQKAQAEKERLMAAKLLELKLKEVQAEIDRLKAQSHQDLLITDLSPAGETAAEYFQVRDRTEKFIQEGHEAVLFVTKIQKVFNPKLQIKFLEAQRDLFSPEKPTLQLFHGTDDGGVGGITKDGFRLPAINKNNMFGQGCYFATDSSKSAQKIYTKGSNKLLLCDVLLGRTWTVQKDYPDMDLDKIKKKGYDSLFSKRGGRGTGGTLYDEYVVYNPYQATPRYIVHYKNQHIDLQALNPHHFPHNLTRIPYLPSSTFNGDDAAEYHFRQAESQFYRMSSGGNHKVVKVEFILNKLLQNRYDRAKQEFEAKNKKMQQKLVFHGTDQNAIEKIIQEGFRIGGQGVSVRNGSVYGTGVYTALDPDTSVGYSRGSGMMLLSLALVGQEGIDFNKGGSPDVIVLPRADILLPRYIVHFADKR